MTPSALDPSRTYSTDIGVENDEETDFSFDKILILDFGSQYTQLIARRVRECQIYSEIHPYDITVEEVRSLAPKGSSCPEARPVSTRRMPPVVIPPSSTWESPS